MASKNRTEGGKLYRLIHLGKKVFIYLTSSYQTVVTYLTPTAD
jgi:hypothetical protein